MTERKRGQTEVVGYVLVFSAVVLTVSLVTISGQAGLVDLRETQRTAGVEPGFLVLADNTDDVARGGVPSRATELNLAGGAITLGEPVTVSVRATDSGTVYERSTSLRPVVYEAPSGGRIIYANGAVIIRGASGGMIMVREPQLVLDSNTGPAPSRTIIPVVDTEPPGNNSGSISGTSRVLIRTERRADSEIVSAERNVDVRLTVDSPRAPAWEEYFEAEINPDQDNCTLTDSSVTCTFPTDRAAVVVAPVGVSFE